MELDEEESSTKYANAIALTASVAVLLLWMSPVRAIWTSPSSVFKSKSTESVNTAFGFVAGWIQCTLWLCYASSRLDKMVVPFVVNILGAILNFSFVLCFWTYAVDDQKRDCQLQTMVLLCIFALAMVVWAVQGNNLYVGYVAVGVNVLMLFGPLAGAREIIRTKSNRGMIFSQLVLTILASLLWFLYGYYIEDSLVMLPNVLGIVFGVVQVSLYVWATGPKKEVVLENPLLL